MFIRTDTVTLVHNWLEYYCFNLKRPLNILPVKVKYGLCNDGLRGMWATVERGSFSEDSQFYIHSKWNQMSQYHLPEITGILGFKDPLEGGEAVK